MKSGKSVFWVDEKIHVYAMPALLVVTFNKLNLFALFHVICIILYGLNNKFYFFNTCSKLNSQLMNKIIQDFI